PQPSTLSLHDALPISPFNRLEEFTVGAGQPDLSADILQQIIQRGAAVFIQMRGDFIQQQERWMTALRRNQACVRQHNPNQQSLRSEEHTSELQSRENL